jgi:alkylation response protein AidB-like acyl-CoA dehydrogenase
VDQAERGSVGAALRAFVAEHAPGGAYPADWNARLARAGYVAPHWPKPWGLNATPTEQLELDEVMRELRLPRPINPIGIGWAGPTLMVAGSEEQQQRWLPGILDGSEKQKQRYLRPLFTGEEVWCQLFSEPGAGSDVASLATRAVRDGDEWIVNGQKVWTSGAHYSDWAILLTRTDPSAPKHRGITYFLVDMRTPGIDVRPLRQITGAAHFNEVFLSDVRIPHENIVGEINAGWGPMMTTLSNERTLIGGGQGRTGIEDLITLARDTGTDGDAVIRQELAKAYTRMQIQTYLGYRVRTAALRGEQPGPESSVMKLAVSLHLHEIGNLVMAMQHAAGMLSGESAIDDGRWQMEFLGQFGARIGGGTDQIQRNTIGEKVLRLPPEPRVDKGIPFRDIPA